MNIIIYHDILAEALVLSFSDVFLDLSRPNGSTLLNLEIHFYFYITTHLLTHLLEEVKPAAIGITQSICACF